MAALDGVDLAEVCITSGIEVVAGRAARRRLHAARTWPASASCRKRAEGKKCARSWRITKDVGADPAFPDLSARDAAAVREFDAAEAARIGAMHDDAHNWSEGALALGPLSPPRVTRQRCDLAVDQAHKWWMLRVYQIEEGPRRGTAVPRSRVREEHGVSYGLFLQESTPGPMAAGGFRGAGASAPWVWLARGVTDQAGGGQPRPDHRRGRQQCHRPPACSGGVADFFSLHAFGFYWYVFNIADVAIVAGVIGLLYDSLAAELQRCRKGH